jgi:hypothetical protein
LSPATSNNYNAAYLNPNSGMLYFTIPPAASSFTLSYRVTDGLLFSEPSMVNVGVDTMANPDRGMGSIDIAPEGYARLQMTDFNGGLLGQTCKQQPKQRELISAQTFPFPGIRAVRTVAWAGLWPMHSNHFRKRLKSGGS